MAHLQARLLAEDEKYEIGSKTFDLPGDITTEGLGNLVNKFLKEKHENDPKNEENELEYQTVNFDFLIDGEILRAPLNQFIEGKGLSTESVIPVKYIVKQEGPEPEDQYTEDDWISSVQAFGSFILTGSYDCGVTIWNVADSENCVRGIGHTEPVKAAAWIGQNKEDVYHAVSASQDQCAILWQWQKGDETMKPLFCCRGHSKSVDCIAVHPNKENFATGSWDTSIKLWSTSPTPQENSQEPEDYQKARNKKKRQRIEQRGVTRVPKLTLAGHSEAVSDLIWLTDSDLCSVSWDHTIRVWDLNENKEKINLRGAKVFLACDYSQENNLLATGNSDRHIRLWDPRNKSDITSDASLVKRNLSSHTGWVTCLKWSPSNSNQLVSGSFDCAVKLWDIRSPKTPLFDLEAHQDKVMCLDWSIKDLILSGGADRNLYKFRCK